MHSRHHLYTYLTLTYLQTKKLFILIFEQNFHPKMRFKSQDVTFPCLFVRGNGMVKVCMELVEVREKVGQGKVTIITRTGRPKDEIHVPALKPGTLLSPLCMSFIVRPAGLLVCSCNTTFNLTDWLLILVATAE